MKLRLSDYTWFSGICACALGCTCIICAKDMARLVRHAKASLSYQRAGNMCRFRLKSEMDVESCRIIEILH